MIPIGLFLLFLTGVGPLFAWRRTSAESLRRNFMWPGIASLVLVGALVAAGMRHFYALISFGFCLFVAHHDRHRILQGRDAIAAKNQMNFAHAMVELTHRNTRRYGGYLVHMGIVLMFIGFTGAAFNKNRVDEMKPGDSVTLGSYQLTLKDTHEGENDNYIWQKASVEVSKNGAVSGHAGAREPPVYKASRQPTHEVAIRPRLNEDLYLNFAGMNGDRAVIQAYVFPLVSWIWIGALTLIFGTLVALVPSKVKREYARTQVVGIHEEACDGGKVASCCWLVTGLCWRRPSRRLVSDDVRRVARHISCQCGSCSEDANCMMSAGQCGFCKPARTKICKMQQAGMSDQAIADEFIQEYGAKIYRADPNAFGWLVPYSALALGVLVMVWFVRRYHHPARGSRTARGASPG